MDLMVTQQKQLFKICLYQEINFERTEDDKN